MFDRAAIMKAAHAQAKCRWAGSPYKERFASSLKSEWAKVLRAARDLAIRNERIAYNKAKEAAATKPRQVATSQPTRRCAECGGHATTTARDSSGIAAPVCSRCASKPSYQLSFA